MDDKDKVAPIELSAKPGFLNYAWSFLGGAALKSLITDELRIAFKRPQLPVVSVREVFSKTGFKELGSGFKDPQVWKELGKEGALHGAGFIPGAVLGYCALAPAVARITHISRPTQPVSEIHLEGKLAAPEPQQQNVKS